MPSTLPKPSPVSHHTLGEIPKATMAKADLAFRETARTEAEFRAEVGRAVQRAFSLCGWSVKEAADAIGRERAQVSKWLSGQERPQFDALFAVEQLRQPLVIALAEMAGGGVEVETTVRIRRQA